MSNRRGGRNSSSRGRGQGRDNDSDNEYLSDSSDASDRLSDDGADDASEKLDDNGIPAWTHMLLESIDQLEEKRQTTRLAGLRSTLQHFRRHHVAEAIERCRQTLFSAVLETAGRPDRTEDERVMALELIGLLAITQNDIGSEGQDTIKVLKNLIKHHHPNPIRSQAIDSLAIWEFVNDAHHSDDSIPTIFGFACICQASDLNRDSPLAPVVISALRGIALLACLVGPSTTVPVVIPRTLPIVVRLLEHTCPDVAVAAANLFALFTEQVNKYSDDDDDDHGGNGQTIEDELVEDEYQWVPSEVYAKQELHGYGGMPLHELLAFGEETVGEVLSTSDRSVSKGDRAEQRKAMRIIQNSLSQGSMPTIKFKIRTYTMVIQSWRQYTTLNAFRRFLKGGLLNHFHENPLMHGIFDIHPDELGVRSRMTSDSAARKAELAFNKKSMQMERARSRSSFSLENDE